MATSDNQDGTKITALFTSIKQLIAGGVGGICLVLAGHPMDTIKVRIQTMPTPKPGEKPQFSGTFDCFSKTLRREGFTGLYRGMFAPLIAATPVNAVCFFGYGIGVRLQTNGSPTATDRLTYSQVFKSGMLSGFCCALINAPVERIKCLLQIEQGSMSKAQYKGFWDCAKKVYADGRVRSNFRGLLATLSRDIPASGCYFMSYEYFKKHGQQLFQTKNQSLITLFSGGLAGICFWTIGIPADVIKSKFQTAPNGKYDNGYRDVIRSILEKQGILGFYRGAIPVFLRAFPANAACFFGYEYTMKLLNILF